MRHEVFLAVVLLCGTMLSFLAANRRHRWIHYALMIGFAGFWFLVPIVAFRTASEQSSPLKMPETPRNRPVEEHSQGYVGSNRCLSCHPHEHASWHASYHRTMTQLATPKTVTGDFNGVIEWRGKQVELWREHNTFLVDIEMPAGAQALGEALRFQRPIVMTTGSHNMQAYWYPLMEDSPFLGMLPFVYLHEEQQWIPRTTAFLQPDRAEPDETGRWSNDCIRCHATHGRANIQRFAEGATYDAQDVDTRTAELGISCEACHGPGEQHVAANRSPLRRYRQYWDDAGDDTIIHPGRLSHKLSAQVCGQCHGIFTTHDDNSLAELLKSGWRYRPGDDLDDSKLRFLNRCGRDASEKEREDWEHYFWSDGMVRVSGREYNGLVESPCFQNGDMSCLHCHRMHQSDTDERPVTEWANDQLGAGMETNQACIQCHANLTDNAALVAHTHHPPHSSGSRCYNCHMSYTTYGLLKAMRSHTIDSPDVATSLSTGRPNACNQCHLDRTLAWTAGALSDWYQIPVPELTDEQQNVAASVLWTLRGDAGQRALMAWSFGWSDAQAASGTEWMAPYLSVLLRDSYAAVRFIAFRSLRRVPGYLTLSYDFTGGNEHVSFVADQVRRFWASRREAIDPERASAVLTDEHRNIDADQFDKLLQQRDQRPIDLFE